VTDLTLAEVKAIIERGVNTDTLKQSEATEYWRQANTMPEESLSDHFNNSPNANADPIILSFEPYKLKKPVVRLNILDWAFLALVTLLVILN